jgi:general secretion pathway protein M
MLRPGSVLARVLALALLAAAVAGGYLLVVVPVLDAYRGTAEAIEQAEILLQRQRALTAQRPLLIARIEEEKEQAETISGYLQGPSDALAAAQLQDRLKAVVEAAGGELRSTRILPAEAVEASPGTRRTALQVQLVVTIDGLAEILYGLEAGQPYLLIDELSVRNQRERRRRGEAVPETTLDVNLRLSGFVREAPA